VDNIIIPALPFPWLAIAWLLLQFHWDRICHFSVAMNDNGTKQRFEQSFERGQKYFIQKELFAHYKKMLAAFIRY